MLYLSVKGFEFNTCEKAKQDGNIESVPVVEEAKGTNISRFALLRYTDESTHSMCDIIQSGESCFYTVLYPLYARDTFI